MGAPLSEVEGFDSHDFRRRWSAARLAALKRAVASLAPAPAPEDEDAWLGAVPPAARDQVLRAVFDHSRALGRSAARRFGLSFEPADLAELLGAGAAPCFRGAWAPSGRALRLERGGCADPLGGFRCDYWREAADGLVMGAGDDARLARHQSFGHGDPACVDVLFDDGPWLAPVPPSRPRFAPVPAGVREQLAPVVRLFEQLGATLTLEGLNEGVLHYRLESKDPLCGATGRTARERLAAEVARRIPGLALQDTSPLAVHPEGT